MSFQPAKQDTILVHQSAKRTKDELVTIRTPEHKREVLPIYTLPQGTSHII